MSKAIKLSEQDIEVLKEEFAEALASGKWPDGKVKFQASLVAGNRKAKVFFSDIAWRKMQALISDFNSEVGWHGLAYRGEDEDKDEYYITDIIVYPQEVTGTTVTTDQDEYQNWLMSFEDDIFNNIRFQGHSHVNMGVTPSGTDWALYKGILDQLNDDMFYIFMIWNKSGAKTVLIYDMKKNVLFETGDVSIEVSDSEGFFSFMKEAKEVVKTRTYNYNKPQSSVPEKKGKDEKKTEKDKEKESKGAKKYKTCAGYGYGYGYNGSWDEEWDDTDAYYGYDRRY